MPFDPAPLPHPHLQTLARLAGADGWELALPHDRGEHLLIWLTRGQGVALLDGTRRGLGPHNALFVPARHLFAFEAGRGALGLTVSFPSGADMNLPAASRLLHVRDSREQAELTALCDAIGREQLQVRPGHAQAIEALARLISVWLIRQEPTPADTPETATPTRRLSRAYCRRLVTSYADGNGVAGQAAALGVSVNHLNRACRAEIGRTAGALLEDRILHAAHRLLGRTRAPVQDIARHLGFASPAAFSRFVRRKTGCPPTALRRLAAGSKTDSHAT